MEEILNLLEQYENKNAEGYPYIELYSDGSGQLKDDNGLKLVFGDISQLITFLQESIPKTNS